MRRFLPQLIDRIWNRQIDPGRVFDLSLPLEQAAEGYQAMNERRAIKTVGATAIDANSPQESPAMTRKRSISRPRP